MQAPWVGAGSVDTTGADVDVRDPFGPTRSIAKQLAVKNTGGTNALKISFQGSTGTFLTIAPGESFGVAACSVSNIWLKAAAATTTYEFVAADEA